ncbi:phosphoenolpyruvate carboxykinase [candidate division KSB1 bacterium]|nr:phosphoenolpyruvate carboxykinase [candidate division KSB1 bacterium]RQW08116.1 MAG: phosphoenolpyruvate carboxykinase [candidate division KSB1 bacterium]
MMNYLDEQIAFKVVDNKVIIRLRDRVCETPEELIGSELFRQVLTRFVKSLEAKGSPFCRLFDKNDAAIDAEDIQSLIDTFLVLEKMAVINVQKLVKNSQRFVRDVHLLTDFVEKLYDYWRSFERFLICDSEGDRLDKRPFRTFNSTIEELTQLVRKTYRDIEENITGRHPSVYRQVAAGAELALIALPKALDLPIRYRDKLEQIHVIRQILLYPPLLLNPPMNKRTGMFVRVHENPLDRVELDKSEWLCYPAKVGSLLILVYFHERFYELGLALANLFELAEDEALQRRPDAVYLFGVPGDALDELAELPTVFYDDEEHGMLIGAVPGRDEFGYFGYLKKMILTLHNIKMMKLGRLPFHGAMVKILLRGAREATILLIGDTGTGKSESLEAFRTAAGDLIQEITIIADDMGSLDIAKDGSIIGYGTEIGAFVRLDDLQPGFAFGQLDRTIIMNPAQVNARVVLPVTSFENVVRGFAVDIVLYANNYESVDDEHPILERLPRAEEALHVFRQGAAMSKGTTTSTGLVHTYFVNVFGAVQYRDLHESIACRYFKAFYEAGLFVGQLRTRLGISSWEMNGPREAATALLEFIREK